VSADACVRRGGGGEVVGYEEDVPAVRLRSRFDFVFFLLFSLSR